MTQITISAQIINGHLQHESLAELEGQHVIATLTVVPKDSANERETVAPTPESAEFDSEPPPWLQVEHDLYFPMTRSAIRLGKVKVRVQRGKPSIILPEELPDE